MKYVSWITVNKKMLENDEAIKRLVASRLPRFPETLKCVGKWVRVSDEHADSFVKNEVVILTEFEVYKRPRIVAAIGKNSCPARKRRTRKAILRQWRRAKPPRTHPAHTSL